MTPVGDVTRPVLTPSVDEAGLTTLVARLTSDAREVARAEIALVKARVSDSITRYRNAAVFFAAAGVLALAALIALLVGLILTIATLVGPGFATLIVTGIVLVIAGVLAMIGKGRLSPQRPS